MISHLRKKEKGKDGFYFWLQQTRKCDVVTTGDETSALFLEMSLIRGNLPPYNKQIKEFRNYVYLVVKMKEHYPTLTVADELQNDSNRYFGPFRKEYRIREGIKLLRVHRDHHPLISLEKHGVVVVVFPLSTWARAARPDS